MFLAAAERLFIKQSAERKNLFFGQQLFLLFFFSHCLSPVFSSKSSTLSFFSNLKKIKYISGVLSLIEKRIVLVLLAIVIIIIGWLVYWDVYVRHRSFVPYYGGTYTEGLVGQPQYINPVLSPASDIDSDLTKLVFSSLLKYNSKQELISDLAERYDVSEDKKTYTFYLRKDIKWHDGQEFNADDVVFTVQTIKNAEYGSPLAPNLKSVTTEKVDQYTVKFSVSKDALVPFLADNISFGILPKHIWENIPAKSALLAEDNLQPIGTGPFKFVEYQKDKKSGGIKSFLFSRNEDYFGKKPYLDRITLNLYKDVSSLVKAYNSGEIEGISYIPLKEKKNLKKTRNLTIYTPNLSRYYALFFNSAKNHTLDEKKVRQALAYGLDREKIVKDGLDGYGSIVNSPILPYLLGFNPKVKKYEFDEQKAGKILDKEDWKMKNGARVNNKKKLEMSLTYPNQEEFPKIAEIIKASWEKIGVKVNMKAIESTELQAEVIRPRAYEVLLFGQLLTHDPDPYSYWHSSQREDPGLNFTSFKDTSIDDLLEKARNTKNSEERKKQYLEFQNTLADNVPAIFLYSPQYLYGAAKKIKGISLSYLISPSDRFAEVENWYIKVRRKYQ